MKKTFALLFFLFISAVAAMQAQVQFKVTQKKVSPTEVDLIFTGTIARGWHVYSTDVEDGGPTKATFNIDAASGARLKGGLQAGPGVKRKMDPVFQMEVSYFENSCTFTQRIELTEKDYRLEGYLQYGACDDRNCLPPTSVECTVSGSDGPAAAASAAPMPAAQAGAKAAQAGPAAAAGTPAAPDAQAAAPAATPADTAAAAQTAAASGPLEAVAPAAVTAADRSEWWTPVIDELEALGGSGAGVAERAWWYIFLMGFAGGLIALCTPCVWPIIPMTVSFFLKRSGNRRKGIRDAVLYGCSIVVIYVALGLVITTIFGANALNDLSTNAVFNILFFLMLLVFAASFFGGFEITLPSSWGSAVDSKAERTTGLLSIFLMAFTLSLVSFSCTGPIIGFLLVEVSTSGGSALAPTIGMLGFALALALPFTLFALFPAWLKSAPKSGGWLNTVKVTLGFLELAFALKFLSVADLAYGWHLLDRETFLALWIVIFALLGFYLLGKIRFPHDDEQQHTGVTRFFLALCSLAFAVYMVPGLWGAPLKAVSAFAPPMSTQDFNLDQVKVEAQFRDYDAGMAYARQAGKPVIVDFTGHGCVNCRKMEMAVWHDAKVRDLLTKDYVLISLYVDEKTRLPETLVVRENGKETKLRTVGDRWSYLQRSKFGANAQPFYVLLDNEGKPLNSAYTFDESVDHFVEFLQKGLETYRSR